MGRRCFHIALFVTGLKRHADRGRPAIVPYPHHVAPLATHQAAASRVVLVRMTVAKFTEMSSPRESTFSMSLYLTW